MKYIKMFKTYESTDEFYTEVSDLDYYDAHPEEHILDEDEWEDEILEFNTTDIYTTGHKLERKNIDILNNIFKDIPHVCFLDEVFMVQETEKIDYKFWVTQDSDEWFWVKIIKFKTSETLSSYYKCDQFEGVKKLIKEQL
jgi:hypothetical protein